MLSVAINQVLIYLAKPFYSFSSGGLRVVDLFQQTSFALIYVTNVHYVPDIGIDPNSSYVKQTKPGESQLHRSLGLKEIDFMTLHLTELTKHLKQIWFIKTLKSFFDEQTGVGLLQQAIEGLDNKLNKIVENLWLQNQLYALGFRKYIHSLLNISNLHVSSSEQEGATVHIMEAMSMRFPIVATECQENNGVFICV